MLVPSTHLAIFAALGFRMCRRQLVHLATNGPSDVLPDTHFLQ